MFNSHQATQDGWSVPESIISLLPLVSLELARVGGIFLTQIRYALMPQWFRLLLSGLP